MHFLNQPILHILQDNKSGLLLVSVKIEKSSCKELLRFDIQKTILSWPNKALLRVMETRNLSPPEGTGGMYP